MNALARGAIRVAFVVSALTVAHDLAGISDADAPYAVDDAFVYRLFAASRAAMLGVAASLLSAEDEDRPVRLLGIALIGLAANNNWFAYSLSDPIFWPAVATNYLGVAGAFASFAFFVLSRATRPRRSLLSVSAVLGFAIFGLGIAYPVLTFGSYVEPVLADRANLAYWIVKIAVCAGLVIACSRVLATRKDDEAARTRSTLAAFIVLGLGTTAHGFARITSAEEQWLPAGIDAVGQCGFAALLAVSAFREPRPALARALRWTGFGAVVAALVPLGEDRIRESLLARHFDYLSVFGGEENGRMILTVGSGLIFAKLDKSFEALRDVVAPQSADVAAAASPLPVDPTAALGPALISLTAELASLREAVCALQAEIQTLRERRRIAEPNVDDKASKQLLAGTESR